MQTSYKKTFPTTATTATFLTFVSLLTKFLASLWLQRLLGNLWCVLQTLRGHYLSGPDQGLDGRCQRRDVRCFLSYVESVSACCHSSPWKLWSKSKQQGTTRRKRFEQDCNSSWSRASLYVSSPETRMFSNSAAPLSDYREDGWKRYP